MSRTHTVARGALLLGAATTLATACKSDDAILGPRAADPIFQSYVALGNSITAGWQSGGINDSTQKQSYALLLAKAMNTRFAYPALAGVGCPPPVNNLLTQTRVGGTTSTSTTCQLRSPASVAALTNNVAVPGISSIDPVSPGGTPGAQNSNPLVQLFLGGETMVQKALDNRPTFATVWVGNNDVLGPATSGFPAGATPVPTFASNYAKDINALTAGAPGLKGVLIGVVQVSLVPVLIPVSVFTNPTTGPAALAAASQVAGRPVTVDPLTCAGANQGALIAFNAIAAIKARPGAPANGQIFCQKVTPTGGATDPGDAGVLDITEQASVQATVNGYNAYIKAKADSIGFAYYDPNVVFGTLRADPTKIPPFPNLTSTTAPFGQYFSLDGVHPSATAHVLIANELITTINAKYGAHLPSVQ